MGNPIHPIVKKLADLIKKNKWEKDFETAIKNAKKYPVIEVLMLQMMQDTN